MAIQETKTTGTIKITCDVKKHLTIEQLKPFQNSNFKEFTPRAKEKMRNSIVKHGFFAPIFVWKGKNKILDGHHRLMVVREMAEDGWTVPPLPVVEIEASSEKDAAEKILKITSEYARITDQGLEEFMETFELTDGDIEDVSLVVDTIPAIKEPEEPKEPADTFIMKVVIKVPDDVFGEVSEKIQALCGEYNLENNL